MSDKASATVSAAAGLIQLVDEEVFEIWFSLPLLSACATCGVGEISEAVVPLVGDVSKAEVCFAVYLSNPFV